MNRSFLGLPSRRRQLFAIVVLLSLGVTIASCSNTSQAAGVTPVVDGKLKEQVLQIIRENPEVLIESVRAYDKQEKDKLKQARQSFLQQLASNPKSLIGDSPTTGAADQKIVMIEFSDFQCPFCSKASNTVKQFMDKHKDRVTLAYKHFPLTRIHPQALPSAKAAWAAQQQGKFWEFHNALFEQQDKLGDDLYLTTATKLNLNVEKFNRDRGSQGATEAIEKDQKLAQSLGLDGTPFFIINGKTFSGAVDLSEMEAVLEQVSKK
jgi:protein-disulfide isomerase